MTLRSQMAALSAVLLAQAALAAAKPIPCSLTVTPRGGDSKISGNNRGSLLSSSARSSGSQSKTITRNLKYLAEVRYREEKPEKVELRVYYIGYGDGGKTLKQIGQETKALELDKNGRASVELKSPTTTLRKTRTRTTSSGCGRSSGFTSSKSTTSGERVQGCVVQLFSDGALSKAWSSDSRWASAAENVPFSVAELAKRSGRIGLR